MLIYQTSICLHLLPKTFNTFGQSSKGQQATGSQNIHQSLKLNKLSDSSSVKPQGHNRQRHLFVIPTKQRTSQPYLRFRFPILTHKSSKPLGSKGTTSSRSPPLNRTGAGSILTRRLGGQRIKSDSWSTSRQSLICYSSFRSWPRVFQRIGKTQYSCLRTARRQSR